MKLLKKIYKFAVTNYFISIFIAVIFFVGFVSIFKLFFSKSTYIYVRVKVGQGIWWANTNKPNIWFVNSIKKGDIERDLTGLPLAQILDVAYYPWWNFDQYDIFLTLKLKVSGGKKTHKYSFKRSTIGIGAPINFEFPSAQFSGTIIELSSQKLQKNYYKKTITLSKRSTFPWEYDSIKTGDKYFNGEDVVFEVLDKSSVDTQTMSTDTFGNSSSLATEQKKYITVKATIKLKEFNGQWIFAEDQIVRLGKPLNVSTSNFNFSDYVVEKID